MSMTLEIVANRVAELERQMADVLARLDETEKMPVKKEKKEKSPKKEKPVKEEGDKKRRGMTGYLMF
jgi:hypothetical protein